MRTIIAGSRDFEDYATLCHSMGGIGWRPTAIISGCARGADSLGERWAKENGIPIERFPADWATHGKAAGTLRNIEMAKVADAIVAFPSPSSIGTRHMIREAHSRGLQVAVFEVLHA